MKTYELEYRETRALFFTVEAESEAEAEELIRDGAEEPDSDQFESMEKK